MGAITFQSFADDEALAAAVATAWRDALAAAGRAGTRHVVALSGGRVSLRVFAAMAALAAEGRLDPGPAWFCWADERCVPPEDPESNYRAAKAGLLDPLGITPARIHRIRGEDGPQAAAAAATAALRQATGTAADAMPVADLVLLGMGEDGHAASLFPGDEAALSDETSVFRPVFDAPKPPPHRVTLGLGPILAAREVWVVVAGAGKEVALRDSLAPDGRTPLARILRGRQHTRVFSTVRAG